MRTFIQWKGTDICMDFTCECGESNHYDGFFAYSIRCFNCKTVYKLGSEIKLTKIKDDGKIPCLESI